MSQSPTTAWVQNEKAQVCHEVSFGKLLSSCLDLKTRSQAHFEPQLGRYNAVSLHPAPII